MKKILPFFLVILVMSQAFFKKPPNQYTFVLSPVGTNLMFDAISASNGIEGKDRVQLLRVLQDQIMDQNQAWAHMDSVQKKLIK